MSFIDRSSRQNPIFIIFNKTQTEEILWKKRRVLKNTGVKDKLQDYGLVKIQSSGATHSVKDIEKKLSSI